MMDNRFSAFLQQWLLDNEVDEKSASRIINTQSYQIKQWKEQTVSSLLNADKSVEECATLETVLSYMGIDPTPMPVLSRPTFENIFSTELKDFSNVISSAPKDLLTKTDLVFLTGGNCVWYWIQNILCNADIGLTKIAAEPSRIMKMDLPNETVARGLVYAPAKFEVKESGGPKIETPPGVDEPRPPIGIPIESITNLDYLKSLPPSDESNFEIYSLGEKDGNTYCGIKKYTGKESIVVIPETIRGHKVIAIGDIAFGTINSFPVKWLKAVVLPNTVKAIGNNTFENCTRLKTVVASASIRYIGDEAFHGCKRLEYLDFQNGECKSGVIRFPCKLKEIGKRAFSQMNIYGGCIPREVWMSRKTKNKEFTREKCAIFYYD